MACDQTRFQVHDLVSNNYNARFPVRETLEIRLFKECVNPAMRLWEGRIQARTEEMSLFEFDSFLLTTNLRLPMHSQSTVTELPSPNLAPSLLLDPVQNSPFAAFAVTLSIEGYL